MSTDLVEAWQVGLLLVGLIAVIVNDYRGVGALNDKGQFPSGTADQVRRT